MRGTLRPDQEETPAGRDTNLVLKVKKKLYRRAASVCVCVQAVAILAEATGRSRGCIVCREHAMAGALTVRVALSDMQASGISPNLAKLLSYRAEEIAPPRQERSELKDVLRSLVTTTQQDAAYPPAHSHPRGPHANHWRIVRTDGGEASTAEPRRCMPRSSSYAAPRRISWPAHAQLGPPRLASGGTPLKQKRARHSGDGSCATQFASETSDTSWMTRRLGASDAPRK